MLVASNPPAHTLESVIDSIHRLAEEGRKRVRELEADRDAFEKDERALRRHFAKHLERLQSLHYAMVASLRSDDGGAPFADLVAQLGEMVNEERRP